MPYRKAYIPSRRSTYIVDSGGEILVAGRLATLLFFLKEVVKISIIDPYNDPCDVCDSSCDLYDPDMGCTCYSVDKSYACSLESEDEFQIEGVDLPGNPDYTGDK